MLSALASAGLSGGTYETTDVMVLSILRAAKASGAPLAEVAASLAVTCDRLADQRDRVLESLAGPRMARRILLALPLLAFPLTTLVGFDVLHILFLTPIGWLLLICSSVLTSAGAVWSARLVRAAERIPEAPGLFARLIRMGTMAGLGVSASEQNALRALAAEDALYLLNPAEINRVQVLIGQSRASGIPLGGLLEALEQTELDEVFLASQVRARELGEKLLLPLGACSLPAFLCVGVVPPLISTVFTTGLRFS